jgi:hypothetical protein
VASTAENMRVKRMDVPPDVVGLGRLRPYSR